MAFFEKYLGLFVLDQFKMFDKADRENTCHLRVFTSALASLRGVCGIRINSQTTCPWDKIRNPEPICWEIFQ